MTKKILSLVLCFLFLLVGCTSKQQPTGAENSVANMQTTSSTAQNEIDEAEKHQEEKADSSMADSSAKTENTKENPTKKHKKETTSLPPKNPEQPKTTQKEQKPQELPLVTVPTTQKPIDSHKEITVSLKIDYHTAIAWGILEKKPQFQGVLNPNGIFFSGSVQAHEGDSVLEVLKQTLKKQKIASKISKGYIASIGGLSERDCGNDSGWLYSVNGFFPNVSSENYPLQDGDKIAILYTCEMGDVF